MQPGTDMTARRMRGLASQGCLGARGHPAAILG